jgi:hypothetical protein
MTLQIHSHDHSLHNWLFAVVVVHSLLSCTIPKAAFVG